MHICNVRSQVFFPGVWVCLRDFILFFIFLAALSANLHCGKTLGLEKSFEHGKVFQEYGWETRTFEEGKKKAPLIQGGGLRQAHTIEKVENPSSRLLNHTSSYLIIFFHISSEYCGSPSRIAIDATGRPDFCKFWNLAWLTSTKFTLS